MSSAPSPWERIGEIDTVHERGKKDQEVPVMRAPAVGGAGLAMCGVAYLVGEELASFSQPCS